MPWLYCDEHWMAPRAARMAYLLRHILVLMLLAAACYVIAIVLANGRLGFIAFFVLGLTAETLFWVFFWRELRNSRRRGLGNEV